MLAWRICRRPFVDLTGEGARRFGGRWNSPGHAMVYAAETAALAVLEVRVHLDLAWDVIPDDYVLFSFDTGMARLETIATLPADTVSFGDDWLLSRRTALLRVPSVIVPESANLLFNPEHPDARTAMIGDPRPFRFDRRFWLPA